MQRVYARGKRLRMILEAKQQERARLQAQLASRLATVQQQQREQQQQLELQLQLRQQQQQQSTMASSWVNAPVSPCKGTVTRRLKWLQYASALADERQQALSRRMCTSALLRTMLLRVTLPPTPSIRFVRREGATRRRICRARTSTTRTP